MEEKCLSILLGSVGGPKSYTDIKCLKRKKKNVQILFNISMCTWSLQKEYEDPKKLLGPKAYILF